MGERAIVSVKKAETKGTETVSPGSETALAGPEPSLARKSLHLQKTIGNHSVQRLVRPELFKANACRKHRGAKTRNVSGEFTEVFIRAPCSA